MKVEQIKNELKKKPRKASKLLDSYVGTDERNIGLIISRMFCSKYDNLVETSFLIIIKRISVCLKNSSGYLLFVCKSLLICFRDVMRYFRMVNLEWRSDVEKRTKDRSRNRKKNRWRKWSYLPDVYFFQEEAEIPEKFSNNSLRGNFQNSSGASWPISGGHSAPFEPSFVAQTPTNHTFL